MITGVVGSIAIEYRNSIPIILQLKNPGRCPSTHIDLKLSDLLSHSSGTIRQNPRQSKYYTTEVSITTIIFYVSKFAGLNFHLDPK